ncbi:PREDICTED: uncharacterized protein LOC102803486 [Paramuricea clavata]|uniref:PREDICTED: uncharacterized protein LOC102803486 n=1 Tax=Paramuricea clavata TaxID=317549 RepID=A0A6S7JES0_PARCT|nr:PREDICTED: uncharacterized protein LOC102803486 [Paramuricea clavata]
MISDNASTYLSAADELRALFNSQALHDSLSKRGVEWQFIPKRAPWFGEFWESLIGLTKTTLKKILGRAYINLEGLQTIIVEIEAVLNDRPITYVTSEADDPEPLTPSHLLYGRRVRRLPRLMVEVEELHNPNFDDDSEVRERARKQSIIIQSFGCGGGTIHDDGPRANWRLAVIQNLVSGNDGLIRSADIRTSTGRTNRPIARLYPLEVSTKQEAKPILSSEKPPPASEPPHRPRREAAVRGRERIARWTQKLSLPPEDVENYA